MNTPAALPYSDPVRINQIGGGLSRRLEPDTQALARIAKALDLASLDVFTAELELVPDRVGWRLSGRIVAKAVQSCGLTLEPLPVDIDTRFSINLVEAVAPESDEVVVDLDDDSPDVIEDGKIDLGQYAVEQLALQLDPFPRKPGAEFVQPPEPAEISPFAVLKAFKSTETDDQG